MLRVSLYHLQTVRIWLWPRLIVVRIGSAFEVYVNDVVCDVQGACFWNSSVPQNRLLNRLPHVAWQHR
jgi:hypothetical protein